MAQLSISEAIRQSPISRTGFYKKYLDTGIISVSFDNDNKKYIDSSELVRVFGDKLKVDTSGQPKDSDIVQTQSNLNSPVQNFGQPEQSLLLAQMQRQIDSLEQDKEHYRQQVVTLTARLEPPAQQTPAKRQSKLSVWWYGLDK